MHDMGKQVCERACVRQRPYLQACTHTHKNSTCARGRREREHDVDQMSSCQGQHLYVWPTSKVSSKVSKASINAASTSRPSKDDSLIYESVNASIPLCTNISVGSSSLPPPSAPPSPAPPPAACLASLPSSDGAPALLCLLPLWCPAGGVEVDEDEEEEEEGEEEEEEEEEEASPAAEAAAAAAVRLCMSAVTVFKLWSRSMRWSGGGFAGGEGG
jgi:hypothetical protein